jgi:hypothetical protein
MALPTTTFRNGSVVVALFVVESNAAGGCTRCDAVRVCGRAHSIAARICSGSSGLYATERLEVRALESGFEDSSHAASLSENRTDKARCDCGDCVARAAAEKTCDAAAAKRCSASPSEEDVRVAVLSRAQVR